MIFYEKKVHIYHHNIVGNYFANKRASINL